MKRTTIMLPEDLKARALKRAGRQGISFGEFVRESLRTVLDDSQQGKGRDLFFEDTRVFEGDTPPDMVARHDDYLYGEDA